VAAGKATGAPGVNPGSAPLKWRALDRRRVSQRPHGFEAAKRNSLIARRQHARYAQPHAVDPWSRKRPVAMHMTPNRRHPEPIQRRINPIPGAHLHIRIAKGGRREEREVAGPLDATQFEPYSIPRNLSRRHARRADSQEQQARNFALWQNPDRTTGLAPKTTCNVYPRGPRPAPPQPQPEREQARPLPHLAPRNSPRVTTPTPCSPHRLRHPPGRCRVCSLMGPRVRVPIPWDRMANRVKHG
jgi:hypothetical protein